MCVMSIVMWFSCFFSRYRKVKPVLIGLTGKAGAGKTTLANEMKRHYSFRELNFADPLKDMARVLGFEVDTQLQKQRIHPYWKISSRHFLQLWGTELCRHLLPDVIPQMYCLWIQHMKMKLAAFQDGSGCFTCPIVIADVRFVDEAQLVREMGGIVFRIERKEHEQGMKHESERGLPNCLVDHVLVNDGTPHDLFQQFNSFYSPTSSSSSSSAPSTSMYSSAPSAPSASSNVTLDVK